MFVAPGLEYSLSNTNFLNASGFWPFIRVRKRYRIASRTVSFWDGCLLSDDTFLGGQFRRQLRIAGNSRATSGASNVARAVRRDARALVHRAVPAGRGRSV